MRGKSHFGDYVKRLRAEKRITLRDFCSKAKIDAGNYSKVERGLLPPPQNEMKLKTYAKALDVEVGSDEWYSMIDFAAVDKGVVPKDIISDVEVAEMLPVFFRTVRRQKPTKKELKEIVDKIRVS
ncbi:MAG: helix-turn-helix transcriptional regulator [Kiritimatiellaeota bacterium]|nr:helix-turn-helix transcriptional regulator [Kiritimatiellota bacterium]